MKKIGKIVIGLLVLCILCCVGIWAYVSFFLDENFLVKQIESQINARVELKKISIGLFSLSPSLSCEGLKIAKRDDFANAGTPLNERSKLKSAALFLKKFEFNVNLVPLLKKQFELRSLLASNAEIRIELEKNGHNNIAPLFNSPPMVDGKVNPAPAKKEAQPPSEAKQPQDNNKAKSPSDQKPFSVYDLPISAKLNQIGLEQTTISVLTPKTGQRFQISGLNLLVDDIDVDPKNLSNHNQATVRFDMNFSAFGKDKTEQMKMILLSEGNIQPFELKTGYVNPAVVYNVQLKKGSFISSLIGLDQIDKKLAALSSVGINLERLTKRAELKEDTETSLAYKNGRISFVEDLNFPTQDYDLRISKNSWADIFKNVHLFTGNVLLSKAESDKIVADVDKKIAGQAKAAQNQNIEIDPQNIRNQILQGLIKEGRISIDFKSQGNIKSPDVQLSVIPPSIGSVLKSTLKGALESTLLKKADQIKLPKGVTNDQKDKTQNLIKGVFK